jgi:hypothetical protein
MNEKTSSIQNKSQTSISCFVSSSESIKYSDNHPKQIQATNKLIQYIAGDLLPLSTVQSKYFQDFVSCLDPKFALPSRFELTNTLIKEKAAQIKKNRLLKICMQQIIYVLQLIYGATPK